MDLASVLFVLLVIVTAVAAVLAWLLYGPRGSAAQRPTQPMARCEPLVQPAPEPQAPVGVVPPSPQPGPAPQVNPRPPARPPVPDPADPTVRQYERVVAAVAQTYAAIRAVPKAFEERVAMRIGVMAIEQQLVELQGLLDQTDPASRTTYRSLIRTAGERLASIRKDAAAIDTSMAQLAEEEQGLRQVADALGDELASAASLAPYPIATQRTSHMSANCLGQVTQLPSRSAIGSFNALKVRLRLARELQGEIERCHAALREVRQQREALLDLLDDPELAENPPWHRAVTALQRRFQSAEKSTASTDSIARLVAEADQLLARRRALFDFCTPMPQGGVLISEERLPAILKEAEALKDEVRALWQRARALTRASPGAE